MDFPEALFFIQLDSHSLKEKMLLHLRLVITLRGVLQSHEWGPDLIKYLSLVEN